MSTSTNSRDTDNGQLRQNMQRALELEEQLSKLPKNSKNPEERASVIRTSLCEILSDVLLTDPTFAVRKDCPGRLWRHCFYGRINELRGRIAREKKKRSLKLSTTESSSSSGGSEDKYEKNLSTFLSEAIKLYQYLVNMYESKILCVPQSPSQSPQTVPMGVIPGLHKMLIHLGDLHRYAFDYKNAEASYREASLLAPSKGNPYNQLAVVAQTKEPTTPLSGVALYWYARALLAVDEPFDTARANLAQLFDINRTALQLLTDKKKSFADAASASLPTTTTTTTASSKKKVTTMVSRQFLAKFVDVHYDFFQKANGTTTTTTEQLVSSLSTKIHQQQEEFQELVEATAFGDSLLCKMVTINSFSTHIVASPDAAKALAASGAADVGSTRDIISMGLLAKVMTLQFGTCMAHKIQTSLAKVRNSSRSQKANKQQQLSVRLLLPLLLTSDYVLTFENEDPTTRMDDNNNTNYQMSQQLYTTTACDFLKNICNVANLLLLLTNSETNCSKKKNKKVRVLQSAQQPKEYKELAGYRPFQPFVGGALASNSNTTNTSKSKGGYVSTEEAAIVLELHASTSLSMTQESTTTTTTTTNTPKDENKIKIHRFLDAVDRFVGRTITTAGKVVRQDEGKNQHGYVFQETESEDNHDDDDEAMEDQVEAEETEEDDMDNHNDDASMGFEDATSMEDVMPVVAITTTTGANKEESSTKKQKNDESTQSSSDVLVYKESKDGGGTPLLVPGDLLMNLTGKKEDQTLQETRASAIEDQSTLIPPTPSTTPGVGMPTDRAPNVSPQPLGRPPSSPSPAPPPGFGPPPGFAGGGTTIAGGSDVGVGRLVPPQPQLGPSSSNPVSSMLPPGFPSHTPVQQQQQQQQQQDQSVPIMGGSQFLPPGAIRGPLDQHVLHQKQAFPPPPMPMFGYPGTVPQTANPFAAAPAVPQYMMSPPVPAIPQEQMQHQHQQSQQPPQPPPPQQQMGLMGVMPSTTSVDPFSTGLFGVPPPPTDQSGLGEKGSGFMEGASLLDSSLLNTLYIDEKNQHEKDDENNGLPFSQNPFLK